MDKVAGKHAATDYSQELCEFSVSESWRNHEKEVTRILLHPEIHKIQGVSKVESKSWAHFFMSPAFVPRIEQFFRSYDQFAVDARRMTWFTSSSMRRFGKLFMTVTRQAAVHLGQDSWKFYDSPRNTS